MVFLSLFLALAFFIPALAQGGEPPPQAPLVLTDEQGSYPLGLSMDILEDPTGELTIANVASPEFATQFVRSQSPAPNFGYTDSVYWLRFPLSNATSLTGVWLLEANFQNLNYIDLYLPDQAGGYQVKQSGALRPFDTRDMPYYHVVFELPFAPQTEQTFYVRVESGSSMTLPFTLWSSKAFAAAKISDIWSVGLFYGALLIALVYHLYFLISLREANYLYFVLFLVSAILFFATYEGIADQFLWPNWSQNKLLLLAITMSLFFIAALKFGDVFLEQKTRAPRNHRLTYALIGIWVLVIAIAPFSSYHFMAQLTTIFVLLTPFYLFLVGIYEWKRGYKPARYYLISWIGFMLGMVTLELLRAGVLPSNLFTEQAYHAGLIWLVLMGSVALADRINLLKTETEVANRRLAQSEHRLSQTLEGMPLGVVVYGAERKPTYANQRAIEILANPEKGILPVVGAGRSLDETMKYYNFHFAGSDQAYPLERLPVWQAFEGRSASIDDIEADLVDRRVPLEIWANPVRDEAGEVRSVVAAFQDITQRRELSAELEQYQHRLEDLVEQRTGELCAANAHLKLEIAERQRLEEMLLLRLNWLVVVNQANQVVADTGDLPEVYRRFTEVIQELYAASGAFLAIQSEQSSLLWVQARCGDYEASPDFVGSSFSFPAIARTDRRLEGGAPLRLARQSLASLEGALGDYCRRSECPTFALVPLLADGEVVGLVGLEFLEPERLFSAEEIALLGKICLDIQQVWDKARQAEQKQALIAAEERNRLARDLHDSVTQVLFSASLVAEVLPQMSRRDPARAQASLEELRRLTHGALAEMRTLLLELRPASIVKMPLNELLAQLCEAVTGRKNLMYRLYLEQAPPLPDEVQLCFYRVAQESLNNVVKHARASQVIVSLSVTPPFSDPAVDWHGELRLKAQDDGRGFIVPDADSKRFGLGIMRERAAGIGADLSVESQPGGGATVTLTWQGLRGINHA